MKTIKSKLFFMTITLYLAWTSNAFAVANSNYAKGTQKLIQDAMVALLVLIPISAGLAIAYWSWKKKSPDMEGPDIKKANDSIKRVLWAAVIGTTSSGLVALIVGYYK